MLRYMAWVLAGGMITGTFGAKPALAQRNPAADAQEAVKTANDRKEALEAVKKFLSDRGAKEPGGQDLSTVAQDWYDKKDPQRVFVFGPVIEGDNAEYLNGRLVINANAAKSLANARSPASRLSHTIGLAQTLFHEFQHAHQEIVEKTDPASRKGENAAWWNTLQENDRWVRENTKDPLTAMTGAQADLLAGLCQGWKEYYNSYQARVDSSNPDLRIDDQRAWTDAQGQALDNKTKVGKIADLMDRANEVKQMTLILEAMTGAAPGTRSLDELINQIPGKVSTPAELENLIQKAAPQAVPNAVDLKTHPNSAQPVLAELLAKKTKIVDLWQRKQKHKDLLVQYVQLHTQLLMLRPALSYQPSPAWIDVSTGNVQVTVNVDDAKQGQLLQDMRAIIRQLDGVPQLGKPKNEWTVLPEGKEGTYTFTQAKRQTVSLQRKIEIASQGSPYDAILKKEANLESSVEIDVQLPQAPADFGQLWTGELVIEKISGLKASGAPVRGDGSHIGESIGAVFEWLRQLIGRPLDLKLTFAPQGAAAGSLTIRVSVPQDKQVRSQPLSPMPYTCADGKLHVEGTQTIENDDPRAGKRVFAIKLDGSFAPAQPGWSIQGTWELGLSATAPLMRGTWSARNAQAK